MVEQLYPPGLEILAEKSDGAKGRIERTKMRRKIG